jgi:uncharacterized protein (UPF0147 family)
MSTDVEIVNLLGEIIEDRGVPRNIKNSISESLCILNGTSSNEEKIASVISILDDASNDPNLSMHTRTHIWNIVSVLEGLQRNP